MTRMQVLIVTHGSLSKAAAMQLPAVDGVGYIISCQSAPQELPHQLARPDIKVHFTPSRGVSNNRNCALDLATAPYALMADDDLVFYPEGLKAAMQTIEAHPEVALFTFRCDFPCLHKAYPPSEHDLRKPFKNYHVNTFEIGVNVAAIRKAGLRFNPRISFGAPYLAIGEDSLFIEVAKRKGLPMRFLPITICCHPQESSGTRLQAEPGVLRAQGALIAVAYPWTAALRLPLKAKRTKGCFFRNLFYLTQGATYFLRHRAELLK